MRSIKKNHRGSIQTIVPIALTIVLVFAMAYVGAYINGTIHVELTDTMPTNTKSGSMDSTYWHNATSNESRNVTLTCNANQLSGTTTNFYILANGSFPIYYNLTVNGVAVNTTCQLTASNGYNWTLTALIAASAVAAGDRYLNYSWDVNSSESQITIRVYGTYYVDSDFRTSYQNVTFNTMGNISENFDSGLDIVQVVIIITILAAAIGAIFLFTKYR